ncbi:polyketide synthase [Amycolatopsis sp. Hca4]|uniref:beta-ketoacyl [acyl carrier protein] synthase domain-containing protein n=1 Tax=Amycolatopsis sp. Hca4 TaxID=2742131 RepID=UPI001591A48E|nr:polyketide synthase [Amycolatopsis sp. Hca4]QKV80361.1 hypothetical protein HUT10_46185 [Amycolatopsis sp. Hca4]
MRHAEARARGLRVHGAILAGGLNHNGTTNGLAAPSSRAQAGLLTGVRRRHRIDPARIALVETHGTGTELGDPLELAGLKQAFGGDVLLGAVKPLIGHTLVCSGLAGVIKVLLGFRHATIPPAVPAPDGAAYLDLSPFRVNAEPVPWPEDKPLAAVSAFGFTGSNGHVVLSRPDPAGAPVRPRPRPLPFCFSAESRQGLEELGSRLREVVGELPEEQLSDLSQLLLRRPRRKHARVVVADGRRRLLDALADAADAADAPLDDDLRELVTLWQAGDIAAMRRKLTAPAELADVALPDYPFQRQRHWALDAPAAPADAAPGGAVRAGAVQVGPAPADAVPADPVPAGAAQADALQVGPAPADAVPADPVPADPAPAGAVPADAAPPDAVPAEPMPVGAGELAERLCAGLTTLLGFGDGEDRVRPGTRIATLGLDSLSAVQLLAPYRQGPNPVRAHELFGFATVADLAQAIARAPAGRARNCGGRKREAAGPRCSSRR